MSGNVMFLALAVGLAGCMPPSVWTKPGMTTDQVNAVRSKCYQLSAEKAGSDIDQKSSMYEECMGRAGFVKVPQWQAR